MVKKICAEGFDSLMETVKQFDGTSKKVFILFCGSKDEATGKSWCPDCVTYEPNVTKAMEECKDEEVVYIYCVVGGRDYWKNQTNEFRTDKRLKLTGVPTLMQWGNSAIKLVEDQLTEELVKEMIEDAA